MHGNKTAFLKFAQSLLHRFHFPLSITIHRQRAPTNINLMQFHLATVCFCTYMYVLLYISADELTTVQRLCKCNIHARPVVKIQEEFRDVAVVEGLYPILDNFDKIFETYKSDISSKIWTQICCCHRITSLQDLVDTVWQTFTSKLQEMVTNMNQLKVPCREAEELMPTGTAPQQLLTVCKALKACDMRVTGDIDVFEVSKRVRLYGGLQAVATDAKQLLVVLRNFKIQRECTELLNIADVSGLRACIAHLFTNISMSNTIKLSSKLCF